MSKLLALIGSVVGGSAGWALGALVGTMTAFFVSTILSGIGLYAGRRLAREWGA
jgi:hypothetical protein